MIKLELISEKPAEKTQGEQYAIALIGQVWIIGSREAKKRNTQTTDLYDMTAELYLLGLVHQMEQQMAILKTE